MGNRKPGGWTGRPARAALRSEPFGVVRREASVLACTFPAVLKGPAVRPGWHGRELESDPGLAAGVTQGGVAGEREVPVRPGTLPVGLLGRDHAQAIVGACFLEGAAG